MSYSFDCLSLTPDLIRIAGVPFVQVAFSSTAFYSQSCGQIYNSAYCHRRIFLRALISVSPLCLYPRLWRFDGGTLQGFRNNIRNGTASTLGVDNVAARSSRVCLSLVGAGTEFVPTQGEMTSLADTTS